MMILYLRDCGRCCNVVRIDPSAALSSRAMWECVSANELPSLSSTLDRLAFKRAVADRQAQAAEDRLFGALITCAAPTDGEAIGGDHDAIGTNAVTEELKNAEGRLAGAKPDFQAEMRKHVHVWKLCGRDSRGSGIAAHLFDDREVLMDAEETIKDLGFKRGQMAEMREEDRQGEDCIGTFTAGRGAVGSHVPRHRFGSPLPERRSSHRGAQHASATASQSAYQRKRGREGPQTRRCCVESRRPGGVDGGAARMSQ